MKLSESTLELLDRISILYKELDSCLKLLDSKVIEDTDNIFCAVNRVSSTESVQFVNLRCKNENEAFGRMCDIADKGSIVKTWQRDGSICYEFTVKGNKCCILIDEDNDNGK